MYIKHGNILSYGPIIHGLLIDLKKSAKKIISASHAFASPKHSNAETRKKANQLAERKAKKNIISTLENKQMLITVVAATNVLDSKEESKKKHNNNAPSPPASAQQPCLIL